MSRFEDTVRTRKVTKLESAGEGKTGASVATYDNGFRAVVKFPKEMTPDGNTLQRGIPVQTHPQREVAFYLLSKFLGWDSLVPETLFASIKGQRASVQLFVPAMKVTDLDPKLKDDPPNWQRLLRRVCQMAPRVDWCRLVLLDLIAGARDRHATNVGFLLQPQKEGKPVLKIVAWDNAASFGLTFERYRNVFHQALFEKHMLLDDETWERLEGVTQEDLHATLGALLSEEEVDHVFQRLQFFVMRPYKLPYKALSQGCTEPGEFPQYPEAFAPFVDPIATQSLIVVAN